MKVTFTSFCCYIWCWQIDQGVAVPKFGEWDESNPRSADGYTHVFNKVREEKLNNRAGQVMAPGTPKTPLSTVRKHDGSVKFKVR